MICVDEIGAYEWHNCVTCHGTGEGDDGIDGLNRCI